MLAAGAKSVIVSLWSIPDAPTEDLMTEFYRQLQQNSDQAMALRNAMLKTQQQHPNPRDWAAFTLIGEAQPSCTITDTLTQQTESNNKKLQGCTEK